MRSERRVLLSTMAFVVGALLASAVHADDKPAPKAEEFRPFDKEQFTLKGPGPVTAMAFSPGGKSLVAGYGRTVVLWDLATQKELHSWEVPRQWSWINTVAVSPDGTKVAAAGGHGANSEEEKDYRSAFLWDAQSGKLLHGLGHPKEGFKGLAFSPNGKTLAVGGDRLLFFDVATGKQTWHAYAPAKAIPGKPLYQTKAVNITHMTFSPDATTLATINVFNEINLWSSDGKHLAEVKGPKVNRAPVWSLAYSPDGKMLAWVQEDRSTDLLDGRTGKKIQTIAPPTDTQWPPDPRGLAVHNVCFSRNSAVLAVCEYERGNGVRSLYDVATGKEKQRFEGKNLGFERIAFSPDGELLAVGTSNSSVRVFSASNLGQEFFKGK